MKRIDVLTSQRCICLHNLKKDLMLILVCIYIVIPSKLPRTYTFYSAKEKLKTKQNMNLPILLIFVKAQIMNTRQPYIL